jgi:hypothetical protein
VFWFKLGNALSDRNGLYSRCHPGRTDYLSNFFRPGAFGLPARGERFFALFTLRSNADFGTARSRFMTALKCWNSGCASNSAAVSGGVRFSSRALVSSVNIGPSAMSDYPFDFTSQLLAGKPASNDLFHDRAKPLRIRQGAKVVPEGLFVQIPEQVERLHADIGTVQAALQQAPEILRRVCVDVTVHVFYRVVDHRVLVLRLQTVVEFQGHR